MDNKIYTTSRDNESISNIIHCYKSDSSEIIAKEDNAMGKVHHGGKVGHAGKVLASKNASKPAKSNAGKTLNKHKQTYH